MNIVFICIFLYTNIFAQKYGKMYENNNNNNNSNNIFSYVEIG